MFSYEIAILPIVLSVRASSHVLNLTFKDPMEINGKN